MHPLPVAALLAIATAIAGLVALAGLVVGSVALARTEAAKSAAQRVLATGAAGHWQRETPNRAQIAPWIHQLPAAAIQVTSPAAE